MGAQLIRYQQECMALAEHEVAPLAELEWKESGHPNERLVIDWDRYFDLQDSGDLQFFTAREDGKLIGYCIAVYTAPLTTKGSLVAIFDAVYVSRSHRGIGRRLFAFAEEHIRQDGVHRVIASSSAKNPIGVFLENMGYTEIETKYEKAI